MSQWTSLVKLRSLTFVWVVAGVPTGGELGFLRRVLSITWVRTRTGLVSSMPARRLRRSTCPRDGFGAVGVQSGHQVWCACSTSLNGTPPTGRLKTGRTRIPSKHSWDRDGHGTGLVRVGSSGRLRKRVRGRPAGREHSTVGSRGAPAYSANGIRRALDIVHVSSNYPERTLSGLPTPLGKN